MFVGSSLATPQGVTRLNKQVNKASAKLQLYQKPVEVIVLIVSFIQTAASIKNCSGLIVGLSLATHQGVTRLNKQVSEASAKLQLYQRPVEVVLIVCFIQTAPLIKNY